MAAPGRKITDVCATGLILGTRIAAGGVVAIPRAITFTVECARRWLIAVWRLWWAGLVLDANPRVADRIGAALLVIGTWFFTKTVFTDSSSQAICADLTSILILDALTWTHRTAHLVPRTFSIESAGIYDGRRYTIATFANWECGVLTVAVINTPAALTFHLTSALRIAEFTLLTRVALVVAGVVTFIL